jgi:hypothetical protein
MFLRHTLDMAFFPNIYVPRYESTRLRKPVHECQSDGIFVLCASSIVGKALFCRGNLVSQNLLHQDENSLSPSYCFTVLSMRIAPS